MPCGAGIASSSASQSSWSGATSPWWWPGHGRVERDDPQAVDVVDAIDRAVAAERVAEQAAPERRAVVVVAHDPDDLRAEAVGDGVDDATDPVVRVGLAPVGEIAGEHDGLGPGAGCLELLEQRAQVVLARDAIVEPAPAREQVRVTDVEEEVIRPGYSAVRMVTGVPIVRW